MFSFLCMFTIHYFLCFFKVFAAQVRVVLHGFCGVVRFLCAFAFWSLLTYLHEDDRGPSVL